MIGWRVSIVFLAADLASIRDAGRGDVGVEVWRLPAVGVPIFGRVGVVRNVDVVVTACGMSQR